MWGCSAVPDHARIKVWCVVHSEMRFCSSWLLREVVQFTAFMSSQTSLAIVLWSLSSTRRFPKKNFCSLDVFKIVLSESPRRSEASEMLNLAYLAPTRTSWSKHKDHIFPHSYCLMSALTETVSVWIPVYVAMLPHDWLAMTVFLLYAFQLMQFKPHTPVTIGWCRNRANTCIPLFLKWNLPSVSVTLTFLDLRPTARHLYSSAHRPRAVFICHLCMRVCKRGNEKMVHCHASGVQSVSWCWQPRYTPGKGLSSRSKLFLVSVSLSFVMVMKHRVNA